jgi:hypothetical protein
MDRPNHLAIPVANSPVSLPIASLIGRDRPAGSGHRPFGFPNPWMPCPAWPPGRAIALFTFLISPFRTLISLFRSTSPSFDKPTSSVRPAIWCSGRGNSPAASPFATIAYAVPPFGCVIGPIGRRCATIDSETHPSSVAFERSGSETRHAPDAFERSRPGLERSSDVTRHASVDVIWHG